LAAASAANIEDCFIKSKVHFTAASGWLQRLVRREGGRCQIVMDYFGSTPEVTALVAVVALAAASMPAI
jgi:hypothetical protein